MIRQSEAARGFGLILVRLLQPLVPEQMFVSGGTGNGEGSMNDRGPLGTLIELLLAEKIGFDLPTGGNGQGSAEERTTADVAS